MERALKKELRSTLTSFSISQIPLHVSEVLNFLRFSMNLSAFSIHSSLAMSTILEKIFAVFNAMMSSFNGMNMFLKAVAADSL
jgi:hypothetical protein